MASVTLLSQVCKLYHDIEKAAQRQLSAAPLATSRERDERWHATTPQNRAQLRGRASGVRCKAMLGRYLTEITIEYLSKVSGIFIAFSDITVMTKGLQVDQRIRATF